MLNAIAALLLLAPPASAQSSDAPCNPPRYYAYQLGRTVGLGCSTTNVPALWTVTLGDKDSGWAAARLTLHMRNTSTKTTYFWNTSVYVGTGLLAEHIGDDVCPQREAGKANFGFGWLDSAHPKVTAYAYEGACENGYSGCVCFDNQIQALPDSWLQVWVEDPRPQCQNKDIVGAVTQRYPEDPSTPATGWQWPTTMAPVPQLSVSVQTTAERPLLWVMSGIEGTILHNPNAVCGKEAATLAIQPTADGSDVDTSIQPIPASQGMGHLVESTSTNVTLTPGTHTIALTAGSNTGVSPVYTGGMEGAGNYGVGALLVIHP